MIAALQALVKEAKGSATAEAQEAHKAMLSQLFPTVSVEADNNSQWLEDFETQAQSLREQEVVQV